MASSTSTSTKSTKTPSGIFHRRTLPSTCIDLASPEGQQRFIRAISNKIGTEPSYILNLLSQFRTQDEPSFCGISTLVMCLNTLMIDPKQTWKGVWRWWSEELLDCCISLEDAKTSGITIDEFVCLAECQGVDTIMKRPPALEIDSETETSIANYNAFKQTIIDVMTLPQPDVIKESSILVVSYDRKTLGQTGSGHFSPLGAWDPQTDSVLVLDVARFKYPPHWVPIRTIWEAMRKKDSSTALPRGWVVLSKSPNIPTLVKAPSLRKCGCLTTFIDACQQMLPVTATQKDVENDAMLASSVAMLLDGSCCSIEHVLSLVEPRQDVHDSCASHSNDGEDGEDGEQKKMVKVQEVLEIKNVRGRIFKNLIELKLYAAVKIYLQSKGMSSRKSGTSSFSSASMVVGKVERITLLILATNSDLKSLKGTALGREVILLRKQLNAVHVSSTTCCSK